MTALVNSLPDRTGKKAGDFRAIAVDPATSRMLSMPPKQ